MVQVLALSLSGDDRSEAHLRELIDCEQCEVVAISDPAADWDIVVFLVDRDTLNDACAKVVEVATNRGRPVLGVWPETGPWPTVPLILEKYAATLIPWHADRVCRAICEEDFGWTEPEGAERPDGEFKRNKCRKRRAKHATT